MSNLKPIPTHRTRRRGTPDPADELRRAAGMGADQRKQAPSLDESERETLVWARTQLRRRIAEAPTHAIGRLIKEFREIDKEIRTLDAKAQREIEDETAADEIWDDDDI